MVHSSTYIFPWCLVIAWFSLKDNVMFPCEWGDQCFFDWYRLYDIQQCQSNKQWGFFIPTVNGAALQAFLVSRFLDDLFHQWIYELVSWLMPLFYKSMKCANIACLGWCVDNLWDGLHGIQNESNTYTRCWG